MKNKSRGPVFTAIALIISVFFISVPVHGEETPSRKPAATQEMPSAVPEKPAVAAEKPAGEWQTLDITLVDRHVTVKLNGQTVILNQPVAGCTGGALWSDQLRPGPIYLQGDHTAVQYRNMALRPVLK